MFEANDGGEIKFRLRCGRLLPALILGLDRPPDNLILLVRRGRQNGPVPPANAAFEVSGFLRTGEGCAFIAPSPKCEPSRGNTLIYCTREARRLRPPVRSPGSSRFRTPTARHSQNHLSGFGRMTDARSTRRSGTSG